MGFNLFVYGKSANELSAKGGLTGTDISNDYIQAPTQPEAELQLLKAIKVLPGLEKKFRIR